MSRPLRVTYCPPFRNKMGQTYKIYNSKWVHVLSPSALQPRAYKIKTKGYKRWGEITKLVMENNVLSVLMVSEILLVVSVIDTIF